MTSDQLIYGNLYFVDGTLARTQDWPRKWWRRKPAHEVGIFLGLRTLSNGKCQYYEGEGVTYRAEGHFRAALMSVSPRENPVYVLLDDLRSTEPITLPGELLG